MTKQPDEQPNRYQVAVQIATLLFHGEPRQDYAKELIADALGTAEENAKREARREMRERGLIALPIAVGTAQDIMEALKARCRKDQPHDHKMLRQAEALVWMLQGLHNCALLPDEPPKPPDLEVHIHAPSKGKSR